MFEIIRKMSQKYAYDDWVVAAEGKDRDGNVKQRKYFVPCNKKDDGATNRTAKHLQWDILWHGLVFYYVTIQLWGKVVLY